jgi:hypothetical protein
MPAWLKPIWNRWVLLGSLAVVGLLCVLWGLLLLLINPETGESNPSLVAITIIPAQTQAPVLSKTSAAATRMPPTPTPGVGGIAVGQYVAISGTGGDGLRLRAGPGTDFKLNIVGMEQEVFRVAEGPAESDGFTWWYLTAPYDAARGGWAVSKYLVVVQQSR